MHTFGSVLFVVAVGGNLALIAVGLVASLAVSSLRGLRAFQAHQLATAKSQAFYHHVDPIRTPLGEYLFMAIACVVVFGGLPLALAAIFRFAIPLLGSGWGD